MQGGEGQATPTWRHRIPGLRVAAGAGIFDVRCDASMTTSQPLRTFHGRTILILEDNLDTRELLLWTFQSLGAHALGAGNVELAQTLVLSRRPDLIIVDLALPVESGHDFIHWLRGLLPEQGGRTPCIAVTAYPEVFPQVHARGFDGYMRKPIDIGALCNLVASLLR